MNILDEFSLFLKKEKDFLKNIVIKFFICFNFSDEPASDSFQIEHYYIIIYLIMSFRDFMNITKDQILAIIYTFYALIVDDNGSCTNLNYKAIDSEDIVGFSNIVLQISMLLSKKIMTICNDDNFQKEWEKKLIDILDGKETFIEKQYLLKEINIILNKSILDGNR